MSAQVITHTYTIKEVSHLTGLPASTLRYYESIGIINPVHRGASSKQRVYGEEDLEVLDAVACLSATGMSIPDMRQYMANRDKGAERADEQVQLLSTQKRQLAAQAKLLKVRRQYVDFKIAYWQAVAADNDAAVERIGTEARKLADIIKLPKRV
jgi:DNA-binding transcriptional MerR regulator